MNQSVLTLTPGGLPLAQSLGFTAASVICDNYTSNYLLLPDAGKTIPPWTYGAVVSLPDGIRQANASLVPTVPAIGGPPVPLIQASLLWTDQQLPADPGHLLQSAVYGTQTVVGSPSAAAGGSSGTQNFPVPAGTQSIGFQALQDPGHIVPNLITITGHQTGMPYFQITAGAGQQAIRVGGPQWVSFDVSDTSVDVSITADAGQGAKVDVIASPLVMATDIAQGFQSTSIVTVHTALQDIPALWQSPTNTAYFNAIINAGATASLVAALANKVVRVFSPTLISDVNGGAAGDVIQLQDSTGQGIEDFLNVNAKQRGSMGPLPVVSGRGIQLKNFSAANLNIHFTAGYSQG